MDFDRFKLYWLVTCRLAITVLVISFSILTAGLVSYEWMDQFQIFGFPLGVLVLGQVMTIVVIFAMFWFIGAQDRVDNGFGANEEL